MRRVVLASFIGATFEWFDFALYGSSAAVVFNVLFFPEVNPLLGTLAAFATGALGYITRPLGGILFGHFGDRLGRKSMLVTTMLIMGISTVAIGVLPTYTAIGVGAPVILLILRMLQGIGLGGEYAGAALATIESAPERRRGFFGSLPQVGNPAGGLLATLLVGAFSALPEDAYLSWGWRVPFLLSAVLLGVGLYVRISLTETADFAEVRAEGATERFPLLEVLRRYRRNFALAFGSRVVDAVAGNLYNAIGVAYLVTTLGLPRSTGLFATSAAMAVQIFYMPLVGRYSDRIGRRRLYLIGVAVTGLFSFPFFLLLDTRSTVLIWLAMIVGLAIGSGTEFAVQSTLMTEMFPARVRYTALSLVYQLSAVIGGLTPVAATYLLLVADGRPWLVAGALLVVAAISFACTLGLRRIAEPAPDPVLEERR